MKITVIVTTWQVPFDQVVKDIRKFNSPKAATAFINDESRKWWEENDGERCMIEMPETEKYEPISKLGYDMARYELWGGERLFHAMLDTESAAILHEAHYKREFDDKGKTRPGYLINCYVAEGPEGEHVGSEAKHEEYARQQAAGMKAITDYYDKKAQH